jgi:hypothetical protein
MEYAQLLDSFKKVESPLERQQMLHGLQEHIKMVVEASDGAKVNRAHESTQDSRTLHTHGASKVPCLLQPHAAPLIR